MTKGIGIDIIEIVRIDAIITKYHHHFLNRIFTLKEQQYCLSKITTKKSQALHFAGRFAAKEAIAKALGCGFGENLSWHDVEIINDTNGKPMVLFSKKTKKRFKKPKILLSISHCQHYATAVALLS